jgi:hypothetical protein
MRIKHTTPLTRLAMLALPLASCLSALTVEASSGL